MCYILLSNLNTSRIPMGPEQIYAHIKGMKVMNFTFSFNTCGDVKSQLC